MKNRTDLSARDYQLLSAYIDDALSPKETAYVDRLLADNSIAVETLASIKNVKSILGLLSVRKVPRNFMVTVPAARLFNLPSIAVLFRYSTVVSALLLAVVLVFDLFSPAQSQTAQLRQDAALESAALDIELAAESGTPAPIINWNPSSPPAGEAYGLGGGGGDAFGIGGGEEAAPLAPSAVIPPSEPFTEKIPESEQESPSVEIEQMPQMLEAQPQAESAAPMPEDQSALEGNGPILGVRPAEEQGTIQHPLGFETATSASRQTPSLWLIEVVLVVLMLISALFVYFLRKRN